MAITRVGTGTPHYVFNGANTPVFPSFSAGQTLIYATGIPIGSVTLTTPSGWQLLSPNNHAQQVAVFGRTATSSSDTIPSVNWGNSDWSWAVGIVLNGALSDITQIVDVAGDRAASGVSIIGPSSALTPAANGEYALFCGTVNGSTDTFTAPSGFTMVAQSTGSAGPSMGICEQIQTTATTIAGNQVMTGSATGTPAMQGILILLKPASAAALAGSASASASGAGNLSTGIQAAGNALLSTAAVAALTNWATVTLSGTQYTGPGGIHDPNFWLDVDPPVGSVLYYDAAHITIYANGEISSTTNNCSAVVQFFDGTAWSVGIVIITPQMVTYAHVLAAAAGALSTGIVLAGAALVASQAAGGLSTGIQLAGIALTVANAAATLTTAVQLNAAALINVSASGALTGGVASLQGSAPVLSQALGALTTQIQDAGQVLINSQATGSFSALIQFQGVASSLTQASGQLTAAIQFVGNANVVVTAAGAALISSAFQSAANVVSNALGALQTGLLIAGNALVQVSAAGDLSTGVTLSGAAVVDTAAALKPVGLEGQFGKADIVVLSTTGLPVALATFIQGSQCIVSVSYFNAEGLPFVPSAVNYRVDDVASGVNLVPFTPIPLPSMANAITITGTQNSMVNLTRASEEHEILFQITDGVGNVSYQSAVYDLIRTTGTN